jgi:hypothetical protein
LLSFSESVYSSSGLFHSELILQAMGRTRFTDDQPCRKAATYTEGTHGIVTHYPHVRAGQDISLLGPRGHCDWQNLLIGKLCQLTTCHFVAIVMTCGQRNMVV